MGHMTVSVLCYIAQYYSHLKCQTSGYVMNQMACHRHLTAQSMWGFVVEKVAEGKVFSKYFSFPIASINPPILHIHPFIFQQQYIILENNSCKIT